MSGQSVVLEELIDQFMSKDGGKTSRTAQPRSKPKQLAIPEKPAHRGTAGNLGKY
jgi:hypothetical protein